MEQKCSGHAFFHRLKKEVPKIYGLLKVDYLHANRLAIDGIIQRFGRKYNFRKFELPFSDNTTVEGLSKIEVESLFLSGLIDEAYLSVSRLDASNLIMLDTIVNLSPENRASFSWTIFVDSELVFHLPCEKEEASKDGSQCQLEDNITNFLYACSVNSYGVFKYKNQSFDEAKRVPLQGNCSEEQTLLYQPVIDAYQNGTLTIEDLESGKPNFENWPRK